MTIAKDVNLRKVLDLAINIALILAFSFSLAVIINSYISYRFFSIPAEEVKVKQTSEKKEKSYSYISYLYRKITPTKTTVQLNNKINQPVFNPVTSQPPPDIKLIGTAIGENKKFAIVEVDKKITFLKEKDKVGNYTVKNIDRYEITITDGRNSYTIPLEVKENKSKSRSYRRFARKTFEKPETKTVSSSISEGEHYEISKREVEKQTADLGKLLRYVRIVPVVENGETKGYKFLYVSPRSILYKYGLRSGDFIVSVNGMKVRTAEEAFKIYNMLRNEKNIRLEIERKGERKVITYEIK